MLACCQNGLLFYSSCAPSAGFQGAGAAQALPVWWLELSCTSRLRAGELRR